MTYTEAERFYSQDKKDYEIRNNKELLSWVKAKINEGYCCYIGPEGLQDTINMIANWYEIKYPERELEYYEGVTYPHFKNIKRMSNVMNMDQLLYRLPARQLFLMWCKYRARGCEQGRVYKDDGWKSLIFMPIYKKEQAKDDFSNCKLSNFFLLYVDQETGKVSKDYDLEKVIGYEKEMDMEELLSIFKEKYHDTLDYSELEKCLFNHKIDLELRNRILQLVALKLLYSKNTTPERGYERAKRFINEFNKKLGTDLTTGEIDEIINKDYINGEEWKCVTQDGTIEKNDDTVTVKGEKSKRKSIFNK